MTFDADKLRALDEEATTGELTGCGRYIGERYDAFIEDANFSTADYNRAADGRLVQYLWNNRTAILAMAEENKRLREALEDLQGDGSASGTWAIAVEPLIARFNVAAQFGADAVHNGEGAKAIADLMQSMADRLDRACVIARRALRSGEREG